MVAVGQGVNGNRPTGLKPVPLRAGALGNPAPPARVVPLFEIYGAPVGQSNTQFGSVPAPTDACIAAVHGAGGYGQSAPAGQEAVMVPPL